MKWTAESAAFPPGGRRAIAGLNASGGRANGSNSSGGGSSSGHYPGLNPFHQRVGWTMDGGQPRGQGSPT